MASSTDYGRRLIPQILDSLARTDPDRIIYSIATSSDISRGLREISARSFAQAVDRTAWWLHNQIEHLPSIQSVGYIGPHDIRHILLTYACVKVNCTALFLSPKNSTEAALAVLEAAKCNIWVKPQEQATLPLVEDFLRLRQMKVLEIPEFDELVNDQAVDSFPYTKTFDEAIQDPFCLLHTSGSTGLPKPIPWSHGLIGTMDAVRLLPATDGDDGLLPWTSDWREHDRIYSSFPMSHGAGIIMDIIMPSLFGMHCIMGPAGVIPNMNLIESLIDHGKIDVWSMVPSLVDELGETPDVLTKFKSSRFICASGGPVTPSSASKVNDAIRVLNLTGTTEGLFIGNLVVPREDWLYFAFHPYSGFEFKEVEPGIYEHWVHRNSQWHLFQGIFHTFPDQKSINLKDLYVKHPTKPNLWAYKGRNDDIVVLSNGYKISPLDTEALITTHPAINGCLMIGTGKPQAGLLIELKDPTSGNNELFDSIWETVEKANELSLHKNQLQKDYITFTDPDMPFVRTDKATIKRRATLIMYGDHIERFYSSRLDDLDENFAITVDTSSLESITEATHHIFNTMFPPLQNKSPDTDIFSLGLDSIVVFRAIKSLRVAMGLHDRLSPRHLYANPTLNKFCALLEQLVIQARNAAGSGSESAVDDDAAKLNEMMAQHKSRLHFKMNPFDLMNPNIYVGMNFFIPLLEGASFEQAFRRLQAGLCRTMELLPILEGKVMRCSEQEMGYRKGELRVTLPPLPSTATSNNKGNISAKGPRQLKFKDLSQVIPSFQQLRKDGFVTGAFKDELVIDSAWFPSLPADVFAAQANFINGGCILALNIHHACMDGGGVITVLRVWAESCRYVQGNTSATCSWLDPESLNRSLPHVLYEHEGYARPSHEVDPNVWGFLGFPNPAELTNGHGPEHQKVKPAAVKSSLPPAPAFPRKFAWPPTPPKDGRNMKSTTFVISRENVQKLRQEVISDPEAKGVITSVADIVQAFFWRAAMKARYRVARELHGETFSPDQISIAEIPIDARPYFSTLLPPTYMGNLLVTSRPCIPVEELCSPDTGVGRIAYLVREAAAHITPALVHDAFTLLQSIPDYTTLTNACMGISGMHAMINNLMLFDTSDIRFGDEFFGNKGGSPDTVRLHMDKFNTAFRLLIILPQRSDGGVELLLGTLPEEFEMLTKDEEFTQYATFVG